MFCDFLPRRMFYLGFAAVMGCASCSPAASPAPTPPTPTPPTPELEAPLPPLLGSGFENPGGMWLPSQLAAPEHAAAFERLQVKLTPKQLTEPFSAPLSAIVFLGSCSASFVSPEGLIITNHHCVTSALQYNSTPKADLANIGFLAKTKAEERSNGPAARVYITQRYEDVTEAMRKGLAEIKDPAARHREQDLREKALIKACEEKTESVRCQVSSFFGGARYQLIESLELRDIRLVYAPHRGIGNFGGEIDNWRWPRHTGDFAFYRAYVGKDGKPADYSADNVPYRPKHHLRVAKAGLRPQDFVMVAGFPANTSRMATAFEVNEAVSWFYPWRIGLCEHYLPVLERLGKGDADAQIKGTPLVRGLGNVLTYTKGALEGLTTGGTLEVKTKAEEELKAFIAADPERKKQWGTLFSDLERLAKQREATRAVDLSLFEFVRLTTLLSAAEQIVHQAEERPKPDEKRDAGFQARDEKQLKQALESLDKRYSAKLDSHLLVEALMRASELPKAQHPALLKQLAGGKADHAALEAKVSAMFDSTELKDAKRRVELFETATLAQLKQSKDPLVQAAVALRADLEAKERREHAYEGELALIRPRYYEALSAFKARELAPDANRTLRITYGTVRGYAPKPGAKVYEPFTTLPELAAKITGKEPFDPPPRLSKAIERGEFGPYRSADLRTLPVNFLTDLDITGGNSGSATLNQHGELVGLAFDGNYEAMASDWLFMPHITRSIHVDIRFVLWVMDAVDGADALLSEMGVEPSID